MMEKIHERIAKLSFIFFLAFFHTQVTTTHDGRLSFAGKNKPTEPQNLTIQILANEKKELKIKIKNESSNESEDFDIAVKNIFIKEDTEKGNDEEVNEVQAIDIASNNNLIGVKESRHNSGQKGVNIDDKIKFAIKPPKAYSLSQQQLKREFKNKKIKLKPGVFQEHTKHNESKQQNNFSLKQQTALQQRKQNSNKANPQNKSKSLENFYPKNQNIKLDKEIIFKNGSLQSTLIPLKTSQQININDDNRIIKWERNWKKNNDERRRRKRRGNVIVRQNDGENNTSGNYDYSFGSDNEEDYGDYNEESTNRKMNYEVGEYSKDMYVLDEKYLKEEKESGNEQRIETTNKKDSTKKDFKMQSEEIYTSHESSYNYNDEEDAWVDDGSDDKRKEDRGNNDKDNMRKGGDEMGDDDVDRSDNDEMGDDDDEMGDDDDDDDNEMGDDDMSEDGDDEEVYYYYQGPPVLIEKYPRIIWASVGGSVRLTCPLMQSVSQPNEMKNHKGTNAKSNRVGKKINGNKFNKKDRRSRDSVVNFRNDENEDVLENEEIDIFKAEIGREILKNLSNTENRYTKKQAAINQQSSQKQQLLNHIEQHELEHILIEWGKNGRFIGLGWKRFKLKKDHLSIPHVKTIDSGNYTCTATNGHGSVTGYYLLCVNEMRGVRRISQDARVDNLVRTECQQDSGSEDDYYAPIHENNLEIPVFHNDVITNVTIRHNEIASFTCKVTSMLKTTITWFKKMSASHKNYNFLNKYNSNIKYSNIDSKKNIYNNNFNNNLKTPLNNNNMGDVFVPVEGPEYKKIDFLSTEANTYASRLFFNRPFAEDSGVYVCFAKNWKNFTHKEYTLKVLDDSADSIDLRSNNLLYNDFHAYDVIDDSANHVAWLTVFICVLICLLISCLLLGICRKYVISRRKTLSNHNNKMKIGSDGNNNNRHFVAGRQQHVVPQQQQKPHQSQHLLLNPYTQLTLNNLPNNFNNDNFNIFNNTHNVSNNSSNNTYNENIDKHQSLNSFQFQQQQDPQLQQHFQLQLLQKQNLDLQHKPYLPLLNNNTDNNNTSKTNNNNTSNTNNNNTSNINSSLGLQLGNNFEMTNPPSSISSINSNNKIKNNFILNTNNNVINSTKNNILCANNNNMNNNMNNKNNNNINNLIF